MQLVTKLTSSIPSSKPIPLERSSLLKNSIITHKFPRLQAWNSPLIILLSLSPEFPLDKIKMISQCGIYLFDKHLQSTFYKMSGLGSLHSNVRKGQDLHR